MKLSEASITSMFTLSLLLSGCAYNGYQDSRSYAEAEKYIIASSRDWAESVVTGDMSKRRIYFADDFIGTGTEGRIYDKAQVTRETGPAEFVISNHLDCVKVRFFGDTAVVHGSEIWERKDGSKGRYVWTDIWVRRNDQWQIVAAQDADAPAEATTICDGDI